MTLLIILLIKMGLVCLNLNEDHMPIVLYYYEHYNPKPEFLD